MTGLTHHKVYNVLGDSNNQFWFGVDLEQIRAVTCKPTILLFLPEKEVPVELEFIGTGESSWPTNEFFPKGVIFHSLTFTFAAQNES